MGAQRNTDALQDAAGAGPAHAEMLIDRYLPHFDATVIEHVVVDADISTTWRALTALDLLQVHTPLMDAAMLVRGVPERWAAWRGRRPPVSDPPALTLTGDDVALDGWLPLGQTAGREVAFGAIGRFWQADVEWYDVAGMTAEDFAAFDEPGWGRIAANFSLRRYGASRTLATYEARTATPDADSRRRFGRYWLVVNPFVGYIMRATLRHLQQDAELRGGG